MKPTLLALTAATLALPAAAQDTRGMDAHVHGVSTVEIAIEHGTVGIDLLSPGMDIVGFEYAASSAEDKDAVEAALRSLLVPETVVTLPEAAGCRLTEVLAHLHTGDHDHDAVHDHAEDHDHDHDHDHAEHDHDHADKAQHSEFHVSYAFACEDEDALTAIAFPFFDSFAGAQKIAAHYVTEAGAGQADLGRDAPTLTLK